jgi:hypothetical protein
VLHGPDFGRRPQKLPAASVPRGPGRDGFRAPDGPGNGFDGRRFVNRYRYCS